MSDWQPARLIEVHARIAHPGEYLPESEIADWLRRRVMIRPIRANRFELKRLREECDCPDGKLFYEIRDDFDVGELLYVCEHEALTD